MTKRPSADHLCTSCGHASPTWFGRCPQCRAWSSAAAPAPGATDALEVTSLSDAACGAPRLETGVADVDRVLGGGIVPGAVVLVAGEPGIGKSTLVLQVIDGLMGAGHGCLLITGEESVDQVALRAGRLGMAMEHVRVAASTSLPAVLATSGAARPAALVIDSIQTLEDPSLEQSGGSVVQVRECAAALARHAKGAGTAVILVGHVTKDGSVAGPKTLEHVVDAVLMLDGERSGSLRLLRASKNRFGSCEETGVFVMSPRGLHPVPDPSALLLADRRAGVSGSVVFPGLEGTRPVLVEIQALVDSTKAAQPRRVSIGTDPRRLALLLGVLANRASVLLQGHDVFLASAGGMAVREPGADLAICLGLHAALEDLVIEPDVVAVGEVGLGGEVRRVPGIERRLAEAARLGFERALVPRNTDAVVTNIACKEVGTLAEAVHAVPVSPRTTRAARLADGLGVLPWDRGDNGASSPRLQGVPGAGRLTSQEVGSS